MDIVACLDSGFVMPTGVMMHSVCMNNKDTDIVFHLVIDESVSEQDKKDLEETVTAFEEKTLSFYKVDSRDFAELPALKRKTHLNQSTYYRLILSKILPDNLDKVLYLDGDIIVRHSLLPLWNTNLKDYAVAASTDFYSGVIQFYNRLRYPSQYGYFNAGVLLINLDYWRTHDVQISFFRFMKEHPDSIYFHDQDVLNAVFYNNKLSLPIKYNLMTLFLSKWPQFDYWKYQKQLSEAIEDPVIIHYSGEKPWEYCRYALPFESTFFKYQSLTKWKNVPLKDRRKWMMRFRHFVADKMRGIGFIAPLPQIYVETKPVD